MKLIFIDLYNMGLKLLSQPHSAIKLVFKCFNL
jgi:hypothetical protein